MNIELDDMPLVKHVRDSETGATKDLRSVSNISTSEGRSIVEIEIPGLEGGILQDLGRQPLRICFDGVFFGESAKGNLQRLRSKFKMGVPVSFTSDLSGAAEVTKVLIEDLSIKDAGAVASHYDYSIVLKEYLEPRKTVEEEPASQEERAKEEVRQKSDDAEASVNYVTGKVLDAEGNPMEGIDVKITWDEGELTVKTDSEGIYKKDDMKPGKYTITVEAEGYGDQKEEVEIKKS